MTLQQAFRDALAAHANPERAAQQQRYMKSAMPYYGLTLPETRKVGAAVIRAHPLATRAEWLDAVRTVWDGAEHREEWYLTLQLWRARPYREWASEVPCLSTLRHLILTGAWWDVVDELAAHGVGPILGRHPDSVTPALRDWARDPNLWIRRTSIICQLAFKADTDTDLLSHAISGSIDDRDFFARKAIGWALREYAKTSPETAAWVRDYVADNAERLSPLSKREALKHLGQVSPR